MEISFDKEADAMYIEFQKGEFASNKKIDDFISKFCEEFTKKFINLSAIVPYNECCIY